MFWAQGPRGRGRFGPVIPADHWGYPLIRHCFAFSFIVLFGILFIFLSAVSFIFFLLSHALIFILFITKRVYFPVFWVLGPRARGPVGPLTPAAHWGFEFSFVICLRSHSLLFLLSHSLFLILFNPKIFIFLCSGPWPEGLRAQGPVGPLISAARWGFVIRYWIAFSLFFTLFNPKNLCPYVLSPGPKGQRPGAKLDLWYQLRIKDLRFHSVFVCVLIHCSFCCLIHFYFLLSHSLFFILFNAECQIPYGLGPGPKCHGPRPKWPFNTTAHWGFAFSFVICLRSNSLLFRVHCFLPFVVLYPVQPNNSISLCSRPCAQGPRAQLDL